MARASLLPGFRFHPTDVELVMYYLKRKVMGKKLHFQAIAEVNINKFSPWDLPDKSCLKSKDLEWFFFCPREKKYASGVRVKRATENGYWKTTGKDRPIKYNDRTVGAVKTLVFHLGHPPQGERTDWVLHEYRIADDQLATQGLQDTYVLCKVFKKNGPGPKNGAQYGAPFNEADWADDDIDDANPAVSVDPAPTAMVLPEKQSCHAMEGSFDPGSTSVLSFTEGGQCPSAAPSTSKAPLDESDDEIARLLASFTDDELLLRNQNGNHLVDFNGKEKIEYLPNHAGCDIYNSLDDLDYWAQMNEDGLDLSGTWVNGCPNNMFSQDNSAYIELNDLQTPLSWPGGVTVTDKSSLGAAVESCYHQNTELSGSSFCIKDHQAVGAESHSHQNHQASSANPLPRLAEESDLGGNCLDVYHMVQNPFNVGLDDAYELDLDFAHGHPQNGPNFSQDMERGSRKNICPARLTEYDIPARLPSAAAESLNASYCCGSSIHIKAEVTHRDGECTYEALTIMMEGSCSCWCYLPLPNIVWLYCLLLDLCGFCDLAVLLGFCCFSHIQVFYYLYEFFFCLCEGTPSSTSKLLNLDKFS